MSQIKIIGAGVVGLSCALELLNQGHRVILVDRASGLGAHACSHYAGGMLAPWCEGESAEPIVVQLGAQAIDWWAQYVDCIHYEGTLVVSSTRDRSELNRFAQRTQAYSWMDEAHIAELEPDLDGRFSAGLYYDKEAHVDPRVALQQLLAQVMQRSAEVRWNCEEDVNADTEADFVLDCRGFTADNDIPELRGVRGEMLLIQTHEVQFKRPVRLVHPRIPLYVVPRENGIFMIGATMIESSKRGGATVRSVVELLNGAYALHPAFAEAQILEIGADVRPAFANNLPKIIRAGKLLRVNGMYRHGFLLAPAMAQLVARAIADPNAPTELAL